MDVFLSGYLTTTNGLYLNFAVPRNKALDSIHNTQNSHRNVDKPIRKRRNYLKKLVILDRKNKKVEDFVKQILTVIKINERNKLLSQETFNPDNHKINCHMSFGSIYTAKARRKRCKVQHSALKRKLPSINFVIPIPIRNDVFSETMRQGFSDDYLLDFNRRTDIDFDYYNTAHRAQDSTLKKDKETSNIKSKMKVVAEKAGALDSATKSLRKDHTRFKVISNERSVETNDKRPENNPTRSSDSDSDDSDSSDDDEEEDKKNSDLDSDDNSDDRKTKRPMKTIKEEWNDIIKMPDNVPDSSNESLLQKKYKRIKNSSETDADSERGSEASTTEDIDHKQYKKNEKYVYMQGHRLYNTNLDKDSRRMRMKDYFMPKRSYWTEDTINHLGPYWNSHEINGVAAV